MIVKSSLVDLISLILEMVATSGVGPMSLVKELLMTTAGML